MPACPYARSANLIIAECPSIDAARDILTDGAELKSRSVLILGLPEGSATGAHELVAEINPTLAGRDLIALVSDPSRPIIVDGYRTTQRHRVLILLQRLSHLKSKARALEKQGYYAHWDDETRNRIRR